MLAIKCTHPSGKRSRFIMFVRDHTVLAEKYHIWEL
jgi:hypothetical protein